ncbi:MAG: hypothetical protein HZC29_00995 [Thaumarchaeota archaeon]|nr:hypothetical protein [Nitrososphaerota archaeon]
MTYSIWLEPSQKDTVYLNKIISDLAKKYGAPRFSAHLTVYSGVSGLNQAKSAVNSCRLAKFQVKTSAIRHSDYLWKTIFVNIKKDTNLRTVNSILQKNLKLDYEFKPHVSLIYKALDTATKRKIIKNLKIKKSLTFDKITITRSSKNVHTWKKLYTVRLKMTGNA